MVKILKKRKNSIPLILQPATPVSETDKEVDKGLLLKFLDIGSRKKLENIRVIPQIHKALNIK